MTRPIVLASICHHKTFESVGLTTSLMALLCDKEALKEELGILNFTLFNEKQGE